MEPVLFDLRKSMILLIFLRKKVSMLFLTSLTVYLINSPAKKVKLHKAFFYHLLAIIVLHFENTLVLNSFSNFYKYIRFPIKTDSRKRFWYLENWKRLQLVTIESSELVLYKLQNSQPQYFYLEIQQNYLRRPASGGTAKLQIHNEFLHGYFLRNFSATIFSEFSQYVLT